MGRGTGWTERRFDRQTTGKQQQTKTSNSIDSVRLYVRWAKEYVREMACLAEPATQPFAAKIRNIDVQSAPVLSGQSRRMRPSVPRLRHAPPDLPKSEMPDFLPQTWIGNKHVSDHVTLPALDLDCITRIPSFHCRISTLKQKVHAAEYGDVDICGPRGVPCALSSYLITPPALHFLSRQFLSIAAEEFSASPSRPSSQSTQPPDYVTARFALSWFQTVLSNARSS